MDSIERGRGRSKYNRRKRVIDIYEYNKAKVFLLMVAQMMFNLSSI